MKKLTVALDGPAGSGKSSVAQIVSQLAELIYVDSGAIYRTVACVALAESITPEEENKLAERLRSGIITLGAENGNFAVYLNQKIVGTEIRTPHVSNHVALYSSLSKVREVVTELLRTFAAGRGILMDGRDIGSVVFPNADLKIYLDATAEERARRRCLDFQAQGQDIQLTEVLADVVERDRLDREREIAPLLIADDAIVIDSTHLTREEVIQQIQGLIKEKQL